MAPQVRALFDEYGLNYHSRAAAAAGLLGLAPGSSGCRSPTAGSRRPTKRNLPQQLVALYKISTADKRKRRVMLKLLERKAKQPEYVPAA